MKQNEKLMRGSFVISEGQGENIVQLNFEFIVRGMEKYMLQPRNLNGEIYAMTMQSIVSLYLYQQSCTH